jgi:hypothetical protein
MGRYIRKRGKGFKGDNFAHFAWFGEPCKEHSYGKVKGKGVIFLTGHIQCKQYEHIII